MLQINFTKGMALQRSILEFSSRINRLKCPSILTGNYFHPPTSPPRFIGSPFWSSWKPVWKPWETLGAQSNHYKFGSIYYVQVLQINFIKGMVLQSSILGLSSHINRLKCPSILTENYFRTPTSPPGFIESPFWNPWEPPWKPWETLGAQSNHYKFG